MAKNFPDAAEKPNNDLWQLNNAFLDDSAESLVPETFNKALLDSGCANTVCGETQLWHYLHLLSFDEYQHIGTSKNNRVLNLVLVNLWKVLKRLKSLS